MTQATKFKDKLYEIMEKVLNTLSKDLNENVLIQFNTAYSNSTYMYKNEDNLLYYVKGWRGCIDNSSTIYYKTTLNKNSLSTSMESEFKFYQGQIKELVESNIESEYIIWYDMLECKNGEINWFKEIETIEDFIEMLVEDYHIEDYGYDIEELIKGE